jgi:hypothetical protein
MRPQRAALVLRHVYIAHRRDPDHALNLIPSRLSSTGMLRGCAGCRSLHPAKVQREGAFASVHGAHDDLRPNADRVALKGNVSDLIGSLLRRIPGEFDVMDDSIGLDGVAPGVSNSPARVVLCPPCC